MRSTPTVSRLALSAASALLLQGCVDSPAAPEGGATPLPLVIAPVLSLAGPDGAPARTAAQNDALNEAFRKVNRFRVEVTRPDGSVVLDTVIAVQPGRPEYDFQLGVEAMPGESLSVVLTAFEGETELFRSPPVVVEAQTPDAAGGPPPAPADITLSYSGPGATAASLTLSPGTVVLPPGGTGELALEILDAEGEPLADVPVEWTSSAPAVAQVTNEGALRALGDGLARIVAATPAGLEAGAWIYVVRGTLAYVEGGVLKTRPVAGGGVSLQGGTAASAPAWSADGSMLFYADRGSIRRAPRNSALTGGAWPTVSPDGTKLAFEREGRVWMANLDGTLPTEGPAGTTPVWTGARRLVVGGGSIQRVEVDGSNRSTVVPGDASLPAVGPGGEVAYVSGGDLMVEGRAEPLLAAGVRGRPTWSPDGTWLAVASGEGIVLVPAGGDGPPLPLPGLAQASEPAFRPAGALATPPALGLTGFQPDPPLPGQPVTLLGNGFDDVIPGNNRVFWPTRGGSLEMDVTGAEPGALHTRVPDAPVEGLVRVVRGAGEATLAFEPTFGVLEVRAATPWGTPVPGVPVAVRGPEGDAVAAGQTDESGRMTADALLPGRYVVSVSAPNGFGLEGPAVRTVDVSTELVALELTLAPVPVRVEASPENPTLSLGESVDVSLTAFDVNGQPIERFTSSAWVAGPQRRLAVSGSGTRGTIRARLPSARRGDASFRIMLSGEVFSLSATVLTHITGRVTGAPPGGVTVELRTPDGDVLERTTTDRQGAYRFGGLLAGTYVVRPLPPPDGPVTPRSRTVVIDVTHATGRADFSVGAVTGERRPGDVVMVQDRVPWSGKDQTVLAGAPFNFVQGTDYDIRGSSFVLEPIAASTSVVILSSAEGDLSPVTNINSPAGQTHLESWVRGGGWLLVHAADNLGDAHPSEPVGPLIGYKVPGLLEPRIADDRLLNPQKLKPAIVDHPLIRGPDGVLGTGDDLTDAAADVLSSQWASHGSLEGLLPAGAQVLIYEEEGEGRPVYATYTLGAGRVVVTTQTIEWGNHPTRNIINHYWWTLMGGEPAPAGLAEPPALRVAPGAASVVQPSNVSTGG